MLVGLVLLMASGVVLLRRRRRISAKISSRMNLYPRRSISPTTRSANVAAFGRSNGQNELGEVHTSKLDGFQLAKN